MKVDGISHMWHMNLDTHSKYTYSPPRSDGVCIVGTLSRTARQSSSAAMSCRHPVTTTRTRLCCDEAGLKLRQALLERQSVGDARIRVSTSLVRRPSRFPLPVRNFSSDRVVAQQSSYLTLAAYRTVCTD